MPLSVACTALCEVKSTNVLPFAGEDQIHDHRLDCPLVAG
jgi:hypothetical protein